MTTGYAPGGFSSVMDALTTSKGATDSGSAGTAGGGTNSTTGTVTGSQGEALSHSLKGYVQATDAEVFNGGSRAIAIESELSEQEKAEYTKKLKELNGKAKFGEPLKDFNINFDKNDKNQDLKSLEFDLFQGGGYSSDGKKYLGKVAIDKTLLGTGAKLCKVSAALIELMLQLTDKIYITGGQGTHRGILGNNFSILTSDNNSVTDHAFGRGLDIMGLGVDKAQVITLGNSKGFVAKKVDYKKALDLLLRHLEAISYDLHPDLIMISDELSVELGLKDSRIRRC